MPDNTKNILKFKRNSIESNEKRSQIIEIMENAVQLQIPNKVDSDVGDNWGEVK